MRAPRELRATANVGDVTIQANRIILQAQMTLEQPMPEQDADLPKHLEAAIEHGGQVLERCWFQQAIERADCELVLASRQGKLAEACRDCWPPAE